MKFSPKMHATYLTLFPNLSDDCLKVVEKLFSCNKEWLTAKTLAKHLGKKEILRLLLDMKDLGLVTHDRNLPEFHFHYWKLA